MNRYIFKTLLVFFIGINTVFFENEARAQLSRGALLYDNHCIACHNQKIHWRKNKLAYDWQSLLGQVDEWQSLAKLDWSRADIEEVSNYLNNIYYHYPLSSPDQ